MTPRSTTSLTAKAEKALTTQDYSPKTKIEGVEIVELRRFIDDGGSFLELGRFASGALEGFEGVEVKQLSYSEMMPGTIKAFHVHRLQEDVWFVPPSQRVLVVLHDVRKGSASEGVTMRFVMGDGKAQLVRIPRGVAHGAANPWQNPASIIYFVTEQFNASEPDEHRLPWDFIGPEVWEMHRG